MFETRETPVGKLIANECRYNAGKGLEAVRDYKIRVARNSEGEVYVSTTEPQEYLDETVCYLHPILGISEWQQFVRNHKNWRSSL